jgi:hypothetical protein
MAPRVRPLAADVIGDVGNVLWVLLGTVALVLLIACANVANLFLVRAEARQQELAVRSALGARRSGIAGQLLVESLTLSLAGGLLGLALAGLALVARAQGNLDESAKVFHETLLVSSELEDQWTIPRALGGLAGAAVLAADYQRAARLFGAFAAMRERSGITEAAGSFRAINETDEAAARAALDDDTFEAAWSEGRAMTREQAVAYALEAVPPA